MPGCEHPTTSTCPSGVSSTSDSSGVSRYGPSGSRFATTWIPGAISTLPVTRRNRAGHGPLRVTASGTFPRK
jgi:hypothetical protein